MEKPKSDRQRGPVRVEGRDRTTVVIDRDLIEWGKRQSGGLSETIRRLLREAYEQAQKT